MPATAAGSPLITDRRVFIRITLGGALAFSQELQSAMAESAKPEGIRNRLAPSDEQLIALLGGLHPSYPKNKKLLDRLQRFLSRIDFAQLQEKAISITDTSSKDKFLQNVIQRVRDWINVNPEHARELFKLFEPSKEDIFKLLAEAKIPIRDVICTFNSQLGYILLRLLGFNVVVSGAPGHIFLLFPEGDNQYLWMDSTRGVFGRINLRDLYEEEGERWVLIPKPRRPIGEKFSKVLEDPQRKEIINLNTLNEEEKDEVLSLWYSYIQPYNGGATFSLLTNSGAILFELGRLDRAEKILRDAIHLQYNYAVAHNNLGSVLFQSGNLKEAEKEYREAIRLDPDYDKAYNNLGNVLFAQLGRFNKEAEEAYNKAIRLNPGYAEAHNNLGLVLSQKGMLEEAIKAFQKAIRLINPSNAETRYKLGNVYFYSALAKGNDETFIRKAIQSWAEAVRLKPDLFKSLPPEVPSEVKEKVREASGLLPSIANKKSSSPLGVKNNAENAAGPSELGGIDLRFLPITSQPEILVPLIDSNTISPVTSSPINLDEEWKEIEKVLEVGVIPSPERIKVYLQASLQQEDIAKGISQVTSCIARIFRLQEEYAMPTDNKLKELLVMLEF